MHRLAEGSARGLADVQDFVHFVTALPADPDENLRLLFERDRPIVVTRAPGRLDVMGGIADYSGSLVLQMPIAEAALCAAQETPDDHTLRIVSLGGDGRSTDFSMPLADFDDGDAAVSYSHAQEHFARDSRHAWAAYLAGCVLALRREHGVRFPHGLRILIDSRVPEGKGVSSSAAIEVACMRALCALREVDLDARGTALLCQTVENHVVGAPCGVMDQMASCCGEAGKLLALRCQPAEIEGCLPLPDSLAVWGVDSGIRHAVAGADYGAVRSGAGMGYRLLCELAGVPQHDDGQRVVLEDRRWGGYLANITPSEFAAYHDELPAQMRGADFLDRHGELSDPVTTIDPERDYAVRAPTAHPVHEHHRIRCFAELLGAPAGRRQRALLGECMYQSHASYGACGLGSTGTDALVHAVRRVQRDRGGLHGGKITGGGSGGTVAVLADAGADDAIRGLARGYAAESGRGGQVFAGSSPGAAQFGHLLLLPEAP